MRYNFLNPTAEPAALPPPAPSTPTRDTRPRTQSARRARRNQGGPDAVTVLTTLPDGNTLSHNPAKQGIEIRFLKKPADAVLQPLRAAWPAWKWSGFSVCWYARDTEENRMWATSFLDGVANPASASPAPGPAPALTVTATPVAPPPSTPLVTSYIVPRIIPQIAPMAGFSIMGMAAKKEIACGTASPVATVQPARSLLKLPARPRPFAKALAA